MSRTFSLTITGVALAVAFGIFAGSSAFTFHYGQGWSYFSKNPESCINCHIMQPHYDTWLKSSHHDAATCADCHLPQEFPHSYISKADNGFFHSWAFTFQDFHEPIEIKPRNRRILQDNCVRCHGALVNQMLAHHEAADHHDLVSCMHCHDDVGHTSLPRMSGRYHPE